MDFFFPTISANHILNNSANGLTIALLSRESSTSESMLSLSLPILVWKTKMIEGVLALVSLVEVLNICQLLRCVITVLSVTNVAVVAWLSTMGKNYMIVLQCAEYILFLQTLIVKVSMITVDVMMGILIWLIIYKNMLLLLIKHPTKSNVDFYNA